MDRLTIIEEFAKRAGLEQPDQPRAREVIKGRGPKKRAAREALRKKLRSTCPLEPSVKLAAFFDELEQM